MKKYFGTDGIRGVANKELTPELAYKVAKASAYVLAKESKHAPNILIGRDTRISGNLIESSMIAGFLSCGANVKLLGVVPTPTVAYLTKRENFDAGVVISASHNSYEFNGIKFFSNKGMKISDEIEEEIEKLIESDSLANLKVFDDEIGVLSSSENMCEEYIDIFNNNFKNIGNDYDYKDLKIIIDTANGATSKIAEKVFTNLGFNYKIMCNNPDGININKECGSTHPEKLQNTVVQEGYDIGIAYDGDGDRCMLVDENGKLIGGDIILAIISKYLKDKGMLKNDTFVSTVISNMGLGKYAQDNNLTLKQTKVGDRYVLEEMLKSGYNLGGEESGHIILSDYNPTGDGMLTSLMIIKIMLESQCKLSELSKVIKIYPQVFVNAKVDSNKKNLLNEDDEITRKIKEVSDELGTSGRVLVRPSGTEPLIRVMIEGEDVEKITQKANCLAEIIEKKLN